jgi:copper oxidase (laccase) domain-containing protein
MPQAPDNLNPYIYQQIIAETTHLRNKTPTMIWVWLGIAIAITVVEVYLIFALN